MLYYQLSVRDFLNSNIHSLRVRVGGKSRAIACKVDVVKEEGLIDNVYRSLCDLCISFSLREKSKIR